MQLTEPSFQLACLVLDLVGRIHPTSYADDGPQPDRYAENLRHVQPLGPV